MYITAFQCTSMFQTKIVSTVSLFTHTQSFPSHPPLARISCLAPARRSACFATQTELFQLSKLWGSNWICSLMFSVSSLPSCFCTLNFLKRGFCRLLYRIYPQRTEICNREMRFHCHVFVVLLLLLLFFFQSRLLWSWTFDNGTKRTRVHTGICIICMRKAEMLQEHTMRSSGRWHFSYEVRRKWQRRGQWGK